MIRMWRDTVISGADGASRTCATGLPDVVLRTSVPGCPALAGTILQQAEIACSVANERMTGPYPSAISGPLIDARVHAAELEVAESHADESLALLAETRRMRPLARC